MSYCEIPEFFQETRQKAKKEHICFECGAPIFQNEFYFKSTGKWNGEVSQYKQHTWCRAACTHLSKMDYDGCIAFGELFDSWGEIYYRKSPELKKLRGYMAKVLWNQKRRLRKR